MAYPKPEDDRLIPDLDAAHELLDRVMCQHQSHPGRALGPDLIAAGALLSPEAFYRGLLFPLLFESRFYDDLTNTAGFFLGSFLSHVTDKNSFPGAHPVPQDKGGFFVKSFRLFDLDALGDSTLQPATRRHIRNVFLSMLGQSIENFGSPARWWSGQDVSLAQKVVLNVSSHLFDKAHTPSERFMQNVLLSFVLKDKQGATPADDDAHAASASLALVYGMLSEEGLVRGVHMENDQLVLRFSVDPDQHVVLGGKHIKTLLGDLSCDFYVMREKNLWGDTSVTRVAADVFYEKLFDAYPAVADFMIKTMVNQKPPARSPTSFFSAHHPAKEHETTEALIHTCFAYCSDQSIVDLMAFCQECAAPNHSGVLENCERAYERYTQICKREIEAELGADQTNGPLGQRVKKSSKI